MDLGLSNRRALVMGGSRGLGAAIARALAREGASVIAAARTAPDETVPGVSFVPLDLADRASVDALADRLLGEGGVDVLVNNGGGPPPGSALEATAEQWAEQFQKMAVHLFHLTRRLVPPMIERRWGRIVTVASSGVEQPIPNLALSNGIRPAVVGWSKTLSAELAPHGITVNVVLPGRIQTARVDQLDRAAAEREGKTMEQIVEAARGTIPAGRYGTPEEFADVVAFLASERASYVTGTKIRVDGGMTRSI
jgi:3-oxoacyl-[acyl-carrier protein] reductase